MEHVQTAASKSVLTNISENSLRQIFDRPITIKMCTDKIRCVERRVQRIFRGGNTEKEH